MDQPDMTDSTRLQQLYSKRVAQRGADAAAPHVSPDAILALIQREGPEDERLAALEHVMSCAACHREYEWLTAVNESALEAEGGARAAARRWSWSQVAPLAVAAALLLTVGTAVVVKERRGPEPERGGGAGDIALVAPAEGATAPGSLVFVWHPLAGASRYLLELQRRDGSVAFSDTTSDTTFTLTEPGRVLTDPEYRWWVRETTDGAEARSSALRELRLPAR
jgi:hypothetical protein